MLFSCKKNTYSSMVETTYNLNKSAVKLVVSSDTIKADFIEVTKKESTFIFENKNNFIFKVSKNPIQIEIVDSNGEISKWTEARGYKIETKKNGDTLIVHFFPSQSTPETIYKFGIEYKFYN